MGEVRVEGVHTSFVFCRSRELSRTLLRFQRRLVVVLGRLLVEWLVVGWRYRHRALIERDPAYVMLILRSLVCVGSSTLCRYDRHAVGDGRGERR